MKCLVVTMSAPREHEPNIELAHELKQRGIEPYFLTHMEHTASALRASGNAASSIGALTQEMPDVQISDSQLEAEFDVLSLRDLCFPEAHITALPESNLLQRARAYLLAIARLLDQLQPAVVLQNSGGELLRRAAIHAARRAGIRHLFIRPTPFKGRSTWSIDSERGDWTGLNGNAWQSAADGSALVASFRERKTPIAKLNIPLPKTAHARTLAQLLRLRLKETEPMGAWDPGLQFKRFANASARAMLQRFIYQRPVDEEPFVFYPVHVWHDSAITVRAPQFIRQDHLIHTIADALPQGWKLYVKEHPVSVGRNSIAATRGVAGRSNVRFIAPDVASHQLVERARAVAVINSTAGFEALSYYKPVVVLGKPFYSGRGLTIDVDNLFDLRAAFKVARDFAPDANDVHRFFAAAYACTFPGTQITPGGDVQGIATALAAYLGDETPMPTLQVAG